MTTAVSAFSKILTNLGIDRIFGIPGSAIMPLYNFLHDHRAVTPVLSSHEGGAAYMANAWAQVTGKVGVCVGTTSPGALNMLTGVSTAYSESTPLLVLTGQVPLAAFGTRAYQESTSTGRSVDTVAAFRPVTKRSELATSADHFLRLVTSLLAVARDGRPGPVHISVPSPVWDEAVTMAGHARLVAAMGSEAEAVRPGRDAFDLALETIRGAERPLILLGHGATVGRAGHAALDLAGRYDIPVLTTARGKGAVPTGHPQVVGGLGATRHPELLDWLREREPDVLVAAGTSLGAFSLESLPAQLTAPGRIILVNPDAEERGAVWPADQVLACGARTFFLELTAALAAAEPPRFQPFRRPSTARPAATDYPERDEGRLHPAAALAAVRDALPESARILPDAGNHWIWAMRLFDNRFEGGTLVGRSVGGMGQGLAAAIGAAAADPDRTTVAITGDGCALMHGGEFAASLQLGVPVLWIVLNDSSLSRIHVAQMSDFAGKVISTALPAVDFSEFAGSMGLFAQRVTEFDQIAPAVRKAVESREPCVIELVVGRASPFGA